MTGRLLQIWIKRSHRGVMDPAESATLVEGRGIVGNADQGGRRQVTVIDQAIWAERMSALSSDARPVVRRANFLLEGIDLRNTRERILQIGEVRLRIAGETKPCERMDEAVPGLREVMFPEWGGGAFAQVLNGGTVTVGASARWIELTAETDFEP